MKKAVSVVLALAMCLGVFGCGGRQAVSNDEMTLEIHIGNFGYGIDWLQPMIDAFVEEDWVKEKYPNLNVPAPQSNSEDGFGIDRTLAGDVNTIDLFIGKTSNNSHIEDEYRSGQGYFENLDDIYEQNVPGEDIKFIDKMHPDFVESVRYTPLTGKSSFYQVPWVTGMDGMIYNKTAFAELELEVPNTTDELKALCNEIVSKGKIPFVFSSSTGYWGSMPFLVWWGQYEGVDAYYHFYEGKALSSFGDEWEITPNVLKQKGRLRSLEVVEDLIGSNGTTPNPFVHANVNTLNFTQAQTYLLQRQGLMMPNADWFASEMADIASEGITDEFTLMRVPVISSIIENLKDQSVRNDEELSKVVACIDADVDANGKHTEGGYTAAKEQVPALTRTDYDKLVEARSSILRTAHHVAFIPSYATAKEPAKDFLRFMATDKAQEIFMKYTYGASMPFLYDVQTKNKALYDSLSVMHRDRLNIARDCRYLCDPDNIRMLYYGGFSRLVSLNTKGSIDVLFCTLNPNERMTAQDIYDGDIAFWNTTRWNNALTRAGYSVK